MWTQQPAMQVYSSRRRLRLLTPHTLSQHEIVDLGSTSKTPAEFREFLETLKPRFTPQTYNLLEHNCESHLLYEGSPDEMSCSDTGIRQQFHG